jgi:hypothetical protein
LQMLDHDHVALRLIASSSVIDESSSSASLKALSQAA